MLRIPCATTDVKILAIGLRESAASLQNITPDSEEANALATIHTWLNRQTQAVQGDALLMNISPTFGLR